MPRLFSKLLMLTFWLALMPNMGCAQEAESVQNLQSGLYLQARSQFEEQLTGEGLSNPAIVEGFVDTFLSTGQYQEGLEEFKTLLNSNPDNPFLLHAQGRLFFALGRWKESESALVKSYQQKNDYWRNLLAVGEMLEARGDDQQAYNVYNNIYSAYKQSDFRSVEDLRVAGQASARLEEFHDANAAFKAAYQTDPKDLQTMLWWGRLFREKYNDEDAKRTLEEALQVNDRNAELYVELAQAGIGFGQQEALARKALENNPKSVDALNILAGLSILDSQYDEALDFVRQALEVNPKSIIALAHRASVYHLQNDRLNFIATESEAITLNPSGGEFYLTISQNCTYGFRYHDAADFSLKATQVDRRNWPAYAKLGADLLKLGKAEEAQRYLNTSFQQDGFNLFAGNTLTLLDEYANFDRLESDNFSLIIHQSESGVIGQKMLDFAEETYAALSPRYPYVPEDKILIEAYNDPDDFAVRVAGVPHLGLLGVCFGDVIALQTPEAQGTDGTYNWARTLWHEIAHTMAIGVSDFRTPRWFTEGLSVYEEKEARPEWGREMDLQFFSAYDQDKLFPLAEIDQGFTRPTFPGQIILSYYHASKIIEFIVENHGFGAVIAILEDLKKGNTIDNGIEVSLRMSTEDLDAAFRQSIGEERKAYDEILAGMPDLLNDETENQGSLLDKLTGSSDNPFLSRLQKANRELESQQFDEAEKLFKEALNIYPEYLGPNNPYTGLARLYKEQENEEQQIEMLTLFLERSEHGAAEARELGQLYESAGNLELATKYLERSLQNEPYDASIHELLASLHTRQGKHEDAVRARRAVVALNPVDKAKAYLDLAQSLYENNDIAEAKRATLQSLELAPGFRDAQKLLLKTIDTPEMLPAN